MSGGLSQCAHADILEGYPDHDSWSGYFFYSKGHLRGVALNLVISAADEFPHQGGLGHGVGGKGEAVAQEL